MGDGVNLDPQGAADGLGAWDTAAETLSGAFNSKAPEVAAHLDNWWGGDSAGEEFLKQFKLEDVHKLVSTDTGKDAGTGGSVVHEVADLGRRTRNAIEDSLDADAHAAAILKKEAEKK